MEPNQFCDKTLFLAPPWSSTSIGSQVFYPLPKTKRYSSLPAIFTDSNFAVAQDTAKKPKEDGYEFKSRRTGLTHIDDDAGRREALLGEINSAAAGPPTENLNVAAKPKVKPRRRPGRPLLPRSLVQPSETVKRIFQDLQAEELLPVYQEIHTERIRHQETILSRRKHSHFLNFGACRHSTRRYRKHDPSYGVKGHDPLANSSLFGDPEKCLAADAGGQDEQELDNCAAKPQLITKLRRRAGNKRKWVVTYSTLPKRGKFKLSN